ncbi:Translin [Cantharellus anzutake]|uniref:Translin n=1 Tax=Cantharellus anzutake TaxID=1750568 RepID=UPI0019040DC2|nr:Translin [Cantharellus anzutake]KAF8333549.1 Translin [Cantharellus anzutake]
MEIDLLEIELQLSQETHVRDRIRDETIELDKKLRTMLGLLNKVHSTQPKDLQPLLLSLREILVTIPQHSVELAEIVPPNQYWRWKDLWTRHIQNLVFVSAFLQYLESGQLLSITAANEVLGMKDAWKDRYCLQVEDYLHGLILLINELSRLAINMVTLGDYKAPHKINSFVKDLFSAFQLLNLKNDSLRRRFDSIKYDVKKIEEVVYDISLRGLNAA